MTGATIQCLNHSANPAIELGAAGWIPTSIDLLTRQVPLYVGHSSKLVELARSLELRSGLSDHFKSGQRLSLQNRPTGLAVQD